MNYYYLYFIIITIIIIINIVYKKKNKNKNRNGDGDEQFYNQCHICDSKQLHECLSCSNCGFMLNQDGYGKCRDGDQYGPIFNDPDDVGSQWIYKNANIYINDDIVDPVKYPYKDDFPSWHNKYRTWHPYYGNKEIWKTIYNKGNTYVYRDKII